MTRERLIAGPGRRLARREFMVSSALLARSGSVFAWPGPTGAETADLVAVAAGAYVRQGAHELAAPANLGHIANVGCIVGAAAVAVIDSGGSAADGRRLRAGIRALTDLPIRYVIATHVHPDHLFGHAAFLEDEPVFVGHARLPAALEARGGFYLDNLKEELGALAEGTEIVMPTLLIDGRMTLDLGGRRLLLTAHPTAHTDNDLSVLDRGSGLFWAGDLVFMERCPVVDGSLLGWLEVLERLRAVEATAAVPGHGPISAAWPGALAAEARYLSRLRDEVRAFLADGGLLEDAVAAIPLAGEQARWRLYEQYHGRNVSAAYAELEWE